uniref:Transposase n=1 Tax=Haemonchus placei TaxID=6290 RepID=A0A0N4WY03_HAEPC
LKKFRYRKAFSESRPSEDSHQAGEIFERRCRDIEKISFGM